ncbi:hypothetical protein ACQPX6_13365 [Actinomycetospora sp. CA-101289]|uniref:hypothetical protein n=1 Tax=Actinomycetospora sp. CA-101289 TaxID=3239893 RepID=UPI003D99C40D
MTVISPDPAITPEAGLPDGPAEVVVTVPEGPGRVAAATLSCRLHAVIGGAGAAAPLTVVVAAGERADDPDLARVLACARESAVSRGLGFEVR